MVGKTIPSLCNNKPLTNHPGRLRTIFFYFSWMALLGGCYFFVVIVGDMGGGWCWRARWRWWRWWLLVIALALAAIIIEGRRLTPHEKRFFLLSWPWLLAALAVLVEVPPLYFRHRGCKRYRFCFCCRGAPAVVSPCHWELRCHRSCHSPATVILVMRAAGLVLVWWALMVFIRALGPQRLCGTSVLVEALTATPSG